MKHFLPLAAMLALAACGSTGVVRVGKAQPAPKPGGCPIAVFEAEEDVGRPFEKVCVIDAKTGSTLYNDRSPKGAMKKITVAACQCGADAVILRQVQKKGVSLTSWGSSAMTVLAIRYTTAAPTDPVYLEAGTKLYAPSGALYGEVIETVLQWKGLDGSVFDAVHLKKANGEKVWISLEEARKLTTPPAGE
jgi:hypothetical protein